MQKTIAKIYRELTEAKVLAGTIPQVVGERPITALTADSRRVVPGAIFVAERGVNVDGHTYIPAAIEAGATVIVCEQIPADCNNADVTWIRVSDSARAMGQLASWWYDHPSRKLSLIGVTGTNGKTTTATLIYDMARLLGEKAGLISTVVNRIDDTAIPSTHTTPDPMTINSLLSRMVEAGCSICAMEVSSHACHQQRIAGLQYAGGIFTNLTRDHLDYHRTFDNYLRAKKSFFDSLPATAFALTNADDKNGAVMLQNCRAHHYTYALQSMATYRGRVIEDRIDGMLMSFDGTQVETHFVGGFNAYNLTAVYGASLLIGWDREEVLRALSMLHPVDGRMQTYRGAGVTAIVDYAHTPDALANVLATLTEVKGAGRIITVTGAGGNRDTGKRPLMAAEAMRYSDRLILTSDNPRFESAADIAAQMLEGVAPERRAEVIIDLDRAHAIARAIDLAQSGDIVLIAGKGHETYQIINGETHHFDDREQVLNALNAKTTTKE